MDKSSCNALGAFLVEIFDQATNDFIVEMARKHNHHVIWLGGNDRAQTGQWIWANSGIAVSTFDDWAAGQPDTGSSTEHCMELNIDRFNSHWNDDQCAHNQRFICQTYADEEFIG
ncbi:hypothetical protein EGW08_004677 [Elysia chlorotica]|uniref:C-type lectin domain-containing protein n=1 Tax=Elysia chlorotica TaxID=188477 RepID=A0A433U154_ELYCH|nr:hypothetical protein EGW08_004677 [Elysia chlorotica]